MWVALGMWPFSWPCKLRFCFAFPKINVTKTYTFCFPLGKNLYTNEYVAIKLVSKICICGNYVLVLSPSHIFLQGIVLSIHKNINFFSFAFVPT